MRHLQKKDLTNIVLLISLAAFGLRLLASHLFFLSLVSVLQKHSCCSTLNIDVNFLTMEFHIIKPVQWQNNSVGFVLLNINLKASSGDIWLRFWFCVYVTFAWLILHSCYLHNFLFKYDIFMLFLFWLSFSVHQSKWSALLNLIPSKVLIK